MSTRIISRRMVIMLVSVAILFGLVFGYKTLRSHLISEYINNLAAPTATISTYTARQDNWAGSLSAVGTVQAVNGVDVTTQVGGEVQQIAFQSGDRVEQDDVLVVLESSADRARLKALQATARLAKEEFERYQKLYKRGSVAQSTLDTRRAQRDQAIAQAQAQRKQTEHKTLRAPFDGMLGIRRVDLGQYLDPGTAVVSLTQLAPIHVDFSLPEQHYSQIATGLTVRVGLEAWPGEVFRGTVTAIEPGVKESTRNFDVQASFANAAHKLRPGMFADVTVQLPQTTAVVVVPRTAISYAPYGNAVYVVEEAATDQQGADDGPGRVVKKRFVQLGHERGDLIAVLKGLEAGEVVATSGLLKLHNDAPVVIDNSVQPQAKAHPQPGNR